METQTIIFHSSQNSSVTVRFRLFGLVVFFFSLILLVSCGGPKDVVIGFTSDLSGPLSGFGGGLRDGARLAVEQLNSRQNQFHYILDVRDNRGDADRTREHLQDFAAAGVEVVSGIPTSGMTLELLPDIEELGLVFVAASVSSPIFDGLDDALFRVVTSSSSEARVSARYAGENYAVDGYIVFLHGANRAYSDTWYQNFSDEFGNDRDLPEAPKYVDASPDYNAISEYMQSEAEARGLSIGNTGLVVVADALVTAGLVQSFRETLGDGPVISSAWANNNELIALSGDAINGVIMPQMYNWEDTSSSYIRFQNRFRENYGNEPGFMDAHSYETLLYIDEALQNRKEGQSFREAITDVRKFEGIQDTLGFTSTGDIHRPYYLVRIENGQRITTGKISLD